MLAMTAVHMGRVPITTAECPVPVVCNASAVSSGNPRQDPPATIVNASQSLRCGAATRNLHRAPIESSAATTPRSPVVVHGPKLSIAQTVPGKLNEKARTPRLASRNPDWSTAGIFPVVSLSCILMVYGSSAEKVVATLTREIDNVPPGTRLDSTRMLVKRFEVSASTISAALSLLSERGLVETRPGDGTYTLRPFTEAVPRETSWQNGLLEIPASRTRAGIHRKIDASGLSTALSIPGVEVTDLSSGYLHQSLQPLSLLQRAASRSARHPDAWKRGPLAGLVELRSWFAQEIGGDLSHSDVTICSGGQASLSILMQALSQPGDQILVEDLTYPGILAASRAASLHPVPIPMTPQGMNLEALEKVLIQTRARLVVVQPTAHNPTGITMPGECRDRLLALVRRHHAFLIEDDFARYLKHHDSPSLLPPLVRDDTSGAVIHIRSLTKAASSNLRIAAIVSRGDITQRIRETQAIHSMLIPTQQQLLALELVKSPSWKRHLLSLGRSLSQRRIAALAAIREYMPTVSVSHLPTAGYHLWMELPQPWQAADFAAASLAQRVLLSDGRLYSSADSSSRCVRISYVAAPTPTDLTSALRQLGSHVLVSST